MLARIHTFFRAVLNFRLLKLSGFFFIFGPSL